MVAVSKNGVMDEIEDRREHNERRTQENLPTESFHIEWLLMAFDLRNSKYPTTSIHFKTIESFQCPSEGGGLEWAKNKWIEQFKES
jgi:hypothetical protein